MTHSQSPCILTVTLCAVALHNANLVQSAWTVQVHEVKLAEEYVAFSTLSCGRIIESKGQ